MTLHAHAEEARSTRNGRELTLFETHLEKSDSSIICSLEIIAIRPRQLAGLTSRSVRGWMEAAENGDPRYEPIAQVIKTPRRTPMGRLSGTCALQVRTRGPGPRILKHLERPYPERWGRRVEDSSVPNVVVLNVRDSPSVSSSMQLRPRRGRGAVDVMQSASIGSAGK